MTDPTTILLQLSQPATTESLVIDGFAYTAVNPIDWDYDTGTITLSFAVPLVAGFNITYGGGGNQIVTDLGNVVVPFSVPVL